MTRSVPASAARTEHRRRGRAARDDHERHARTPSSGSQSANGPRGRRLCTSSRFDRSSRAELEVAVGHPATTDWSATAADLLDDNQRAGTSRSRPSVPGAGGRPRRRCSPMHPSILTTSCAIEVERIRIRAVSHRGVAGLGRGGGKGAPTSSAGSFATCSRTRSTRRVASHSGSSTVRTAPPSSSGGRRSRRPGWPIRRGSSSGSPVWTTQAAANRWGGPRSGHHRQEIVEARTSWSHPRRIRLPGGARFVVRLPANADTRLLGGP